MSTPSEPKLPPPDPEPDLPYPAPGPPIVPIPDPDPGVIAPEPGTAAGMIGQSKIEESQTEAGAERRILSSEEKAKRSKLMAIARCELHGPPTELKRSYPHRHEVTPPKLICAFPFCKKLGSLWLSDEEEQGYQRGVKRFSGYGQYEVVGLPDAAGRGVS